MGLKMAERHCEPCNITVQTSKSGVDNYICYHCGSYMARLGEESDDCDHEWVGSGMPNGMVWCSKCDLDHDKEKHEDVSYL